MTKPHTTLSEAVRALALPEPHTGQFEYCIPGERITRIENGYTAEQVRALLSAAAELVEQDESNADEWRRLALQFDGHRMQAMHHLRSMLADTQKHAPIAQEFVSAPPLDGESVLAQRIAAMVEQHEAQEPIELVGVQQMKEGAGFWHSCSGCYETEDGHPVGSYPYSDVFKCALGNGCSDCGGIGAVWDNTDYDAMALELESDSAQPTLAATQAGDAKDAARWRFMMAVADNDHGPEAMMLEELGNKIPDEDKPESVGMEALVDAAIAAMSPTTTRSE